MILMGENPFRGPLEGVGPEMATSEASAIWAQKVSLPPSPPSPFVQNKIEINSKMKGV